MAKRKTIGRNKYRARKSRKGADRYGRFDNGRQITADVIAGKTIWYPQEEES